MRLPVLLVCSALLAGCASVEPVPVSNFDNPKGIPYYDGSFYLLVWADGAGNLRWSLEFLADPQKKREYRTSSFLSSVEAELNFSNGLLTKANANLDSTAVPKAVLGAVEKVMLAMANEVAPANARSIPAPSLFKMMVKDGTIMFIGVESNANVNSTVTAPPKPEKPEK